MKKFALALTAVFVLAIACGGAATPDQVVKKFIDAFQAKDGNAIIACVSAEGMAELDAQIEQMKATPEESVGFLAMMGVVVTADELANWTAGDFLTAMLGSEMLAAEMPDFSTVVIGEAVIDGETATVPITTDSVTTEIELVLEEGNWKISGDGMGSMM
jgi:hypothetical protein